MLERYARESPVLFALRDWYISRCEELGQSVLGKIPCAYGSFSNGQRVTDAHRLLYRRREDLLAAFPDPYDATDAETSYFHWYQASERRDDLGELSLHGSQRLRNLIKAHAPEPALRLARSARRAIRAFAHPVRKAD